MRTIKFRAWDKDNAEIIYLGDVDFESSYQYYRDGNDISQRCESNTLMQLTGLLDKNKKEIYESDILKIGRTNPINEKDVIVQVKYDRLCWSCGAGMSLYNYSTMDVDIEIIGNIYENPDLLNKTK